MNNKLPVNEEVSQLLVFVEGDVRELKASVATTGLTKRLPDGFARRITGLLRSILEVQELAQ